uniref:Ig-like domain-containing protein n=1 Tax=Neogobius melanostomus TaxID=47308 RepID=A0A8C6SHP8_9GOBI
LTTTTTTILLLLLLLTLLILPGLYFQEDMHLMACSDSDKEDMYGLTGEVMYYADFDKKKESVRHVMDRLWVNNGICKANLQTVREAMKDIPLEPPWAPLLYPRDHLLPSKPNTLVCQASGFYPAPVNFTWTRDRLIISSSSCPRPFLRATAPSPSSPPSSYSSLRSGQVLHYMYIITVTAVQFQKPSLAPSVFCAVGLTLGLVGVAVGTFFLVKGNECR